MISGTIKTSYMFALLLISMLSVGTFANGFENKQSISNGNHKNYALQPLNLSTLKPEKPLRISIIEDAPPFSIQLSDGRTTGLYVEFWRLWSRYNQHPVEFINGDITSNIADLKNATVDFHSGLFKSEQRDQWAEFSIPIHQVNTSLYFYKPLGNITTLSEMNGKKVAVRFASYHANILTKKYPEIKFVPFPDNYAVIDQLLEHKIDAFIGQEPHIDSLLNYRNAGGLLSKITEPLMTNLVYALFPKQKEHLIEEINQGIKNIPLDEIVALEKKWLPSSPPYFERFIYPKLPNLTLTEIDEIRKISSLKIASNSNWSPIVYLDNGKYQGVAIDYLDVIKEMLGIKLNHVYGFEWSELVDKTRGGEIKLLTAIAESDNSEDKEENLILTKPYIQFQIVAMVRPESSFLTNIYDLKGKKVSAVMDGQLKAILQTNFPSIEFKNVASTFQGLSKLKKGEVDAFIGNHFLIDHQLDKFKNTNLKVGLFTNYYLDIKISVHKSISQLVPIINKALANIPNRKKISILNKWKGNNTIEISDQFETFIKYAIPTFITIAALIFYVSFLSRRMVSEINNREVKENSLRLQKKNIDSANRAKDDFLANMSHELRSPMNAIIGSAYLLNLSSLSTSQKDLISVMDTSAQNLLRLINNILDLSKIEAGKLEIEKIPFDLMQLSKKIMDGLQSTNDFSKTNLSSEKQPSKIYRKLIIDKNIPHLIIADSHRLQQVIENLLLNAITYTDKGEVVLTIKTSNENELTALSSTDDFSYLRFEITDTGVGMEPEQVDRVFSDFNQADTSSTRSNSGAGLGLKLTQCLCELMGTKLKVESKVNEGCRFFFDLPYSTCNQESTKNKSLIGKHILIVDDNPINLMVAQKTLENHQLKATTINSGAEALAIIVKVSFDLILMDMQMPEMDGPETTKAIRGGCHQANIPILALSASMGEQEQKRAIDAGMNGYLGKPIIVEQLMEKLSNALV